MRQEEMKDSEVTIEEIDRFKKLCEEELEKTKDENYESLSLCLDNLYSAVPGKRNRGTRRAICLLTFGENQFDNFVKAINYIKDHYPINEKDIPRIGLELEKMGLNLFSWFN